jgi:hypothetical protein
VAGAQNIAAACEGEAPEGIDPNLATNGGKRGVAAEAL